MRKCETDAQCCILQRLQTKSTRCQREQWCDMAFNHNMEFRGCNDIDVTLGQGYSQGWLSGWTM